MLQALEARNDKQILGLELFALALGCSTFAERLVGRKVFLWSDNVGAEKGTAKGKARSPCCVSGFCLPFLVFLIICLKYFGFSLTGTGITPA